LKRWWQKNKKVIKIGKLTLSRDGFFSEGLCAWIKKMAIQAA
jgi:hypothetical protein